MHKFFQEFKQFALKGNVMNMAVGVIIGSAFQGVVNSLTTNILSPIIGLFTRQNFDTLELNFLGVALKYGSFMTSVINFFIMAFVVFLMMRLMNKLLALTDKMEKAEKDKKNDSAAAAPPPAAPPPAAPPPRQCPYCFTAIDPKATRCPACTSRLDDAAAAAEDPPHAA